MKPMKQIAVLRLIHLFKQVLRADTVFRLEQEERKFFEALHGAYRNRIERFFRRRVKQKELASELTQDVFLKAYQGRRLLKPGRDFGAWLGGIARNLWTDQFRKNHRTPLAFELSSELPNEPLNAPIALVSPEAMLEQHQLRAAFRKALRGLSPIQQKAALLKLVAGWSDSEIAQTLKLTVPATKSLLYRVRLKLRDELQPLLAEC